MSDKEDDNKKKNISVRISASDHQKIKTIAKRLRVRESKVFRFAVKMTLAELAPLSDFAVCGKDLLPVFIDHGDALSNHFELDLARLEKLINGDVAEDIRKVDRDDLELIAGMPESYLHAKLSRLTQRNIEPFRLTDSLREYLLSKYVHTQEEA